MFTTAITRIFATAAIALFLAVALAVGRETWANGYASIGFGRTPVFLAADFLGRLLLPVVGATILAWVVAGLSWKRHDDGARAAALGTGVVAALALLLRVGYVYNRYHVDVNWSWRREWNGLMVPGFLWETGVLLRNAGLVVAAAIVAWLLYRLLWLLFRRLPAPRTRAIPIIGALSALVLVALPPIAASLRGEATGPNVLIICLDTLRADHLGAYGYDRPTSPAIDAFAEESVLFEWAISQAEATLPSHMSLFTSKIPSSHGVWNHYHELAPKELALAEAMREAGYRTAGFVDAGHMLGLFGFTQGFERYHDRYKRLEGSARMGLEWLDGLPADAPFFLFVHGYDVHTPYAPWSVYRKEFTDPNYDGAFEPTVDAMRDIGWQKRHDPHYEVPWSDADREYVVGCYDAAIRSADDIFQRFIDALDQRGRLDDTWIIVLSDHGEEFLEHGSVEHDKLYLPVTRVPLIVRPPGGVERATRVGQAVGLIDVFPTVVEISGVDARLDDDLLRRVEVEGRSLAGFLGRDDDGTSSETPALSQNWRFGHQRAITGPVYRILSSAERPDSIEVYRYRDDPLEQNPIFVTGRTTGREAEFDAPARALTNTMRTWIEGTTTEGREAKRLMGSGFETLRNLGYIQ